MDIVAGASNRVPGPSLSALWQTPSPKRHGRRQCLNWGVTLIPRKKKSRQTRSSHFTTGGMRSVVTPQWHLIAHENLGDQLYDWEHDPQERTT